MLPIGNTELAGLARQTFEFGPNQGAVMVLDASQRKNVGAFDKKPAAIIPANRQRFNPHPETVQGNSAFKRRLNFMPVARDQFIRPSSLFDSRFAQSVLAAAVNLS